MKAATLFLALFLNWACQAQHGQSENLIIVTLDGFRWQELFSGADSVLIHNESFTPEKSVREWYWHASGTARREALMPFFWSVIAKQGQLYGNREHRNFVNCANPHWFSYPGYSELFTGFVDRGIRSNDPVVNPNSNVLEFINAIPEFKGKVAAFATWGTLHQILRADQAGIYSNCGKRLAESDSLTDTEVLLNDLRTLINPRGQRKDVFTFYYAFEYLKKKRPRVLYIGLDETDSFGHLGRYDQYLDAAHQADAMIGRLWEWVQADSQYRDKTTLLINTDHGRGQSHKTSWKRHGRLAFGSSQIWFGVIGPDTPATGEVKSENQYYQKQLAKTAAAFLGLEYSITEKTGDIIQEVFTRVHTTSISR
jgi:hypothetical protein